LEEDEGDKRVVAANGRARNDGEEDGVESEIRNQAR
jgi:hypothetical protein